MKIRWKILLVLISISIIPMLAMRWNAQRIIYALAAELGERTEEALVAQSAKALKQLVEDHGRVLKRDGELIEMVLRVQSVELEKRLAGPVAPPGFDLSVADPSSPLSDREPVSHCRLAGDGTCIPLAVSHAGPRWIVPADMDRSTTNPVTARLTGLAALYAASDRDVPGLFLWQITVLENGIQAVYPGPPADLTVDFRQTAWYRQARQANAVHWSMPIVDPFTRQIVIPVAVPIQGPNRKFLGTAAAMVPVGALLHENRHIRMISGNVTSLLVRPEYRSKRDSNDRVAGIMIIASEDGQSSGREQWRYHNTSRWLSSDTPDALGPVISDLLRRRSGIADLFYHGRAAVVAYSVMTTEGTSLLLIVPRKDLTADARDMERYVQVRFAEEMRTTGLILSAVLAGVILLSFLLSRYVTINIQKLLEGSRRLATGDFTTRIDVRSRDEIGELGRAFNRMVPDLEERIRLKQGIDVAGSVQKNLLPKSDPVFPGTDIAAASRYCDETGGDFYDFIALDRGGAPGIGIAVGDASDHGISAALLMATGRAFLKGRMAAPGSPAQIVGDVNRLLCSDTDVTDQFITMFYIEMIADTGAVDWVRAGHDPGLLYDPEKDAFVELKGEGAVMGVDRNIVYTANRRTGIKAGQMIAVGTDGIWETRNEAGEMFGKERFREILRKRHAAPAREILERVVAAVKAFRGKASQLDDVTLVVVKIL